MKSPVFDNSYVNLPDVLWRRQAPTPLRNPRLLHVNEKLITELALDSAWWHSPEALSGLSGHSVWPGADPIAMKYGGHQFGGWNPELGDGRGLLLGEVLDTQHKRWDLHLKGSGPTPFSRMGDGRAVLRSSIREYLAGEALHALGVPTTRALALVGSEQPVRRERMETGASLLRIADSHVRFGHFEWLFYAGNQPALLARLADYVIARHYPECLQQAHPHAAFLDAVVQRTARLMADWQALGFAHGVMNTDNFSITGLTLDFGPYGFLETYDPYLICNHSDHNGRYAWYLQPSVGLWNLNALAQALTPLVPLESLKASLAGYEQALTEHYDSAMRRRLGLLDVEVEDRQLVQSWLQLLQAAKVDFSRSFRLLAEHSLTELLATVGNYWGEQMEAAREWLLRYQARLQRAGHDDSERQARMCLVNPRYILRNYLAEIAIKAAEEGDMQPFNTLLEVLQNPFEYRPEWDAYAAEAPAWGRCLDISCSS